MKTYFFPRFVLVFILALTSQLQVYAQQFVKVAKDVEVKTTSGQTITLFADSKLKLDSISFKVKIVQVSDRASQSKKNQDGGIKKDSILSGEEYSTESKDLKFRDATGEIRYNIEGVEIEATDAFYRSTFQQDNLTDTLLIPIDYAMQCGASTHQSLRSQFRYDNNNNKLVFTSTENISFKVVINGSKPVKYPDSKEFTANKSDIVRLIFPDDNYADEVFSVSDVTQINSEWKEIIIPVGGILLCIIIFAGCYFFFFKRQRSSDKNNIDSGKTKKNKKKYKKEDIENRQPKDFDYQMFSNPTATDIEELSRFRQDFLKLESSLSSIKPILETLNQKISGQTEITKLQTQVQALEREKSSLETQIKAKDSELSEKANQIDTLYTEKSKLQDQLVEAKKFEGTIIVEGYEEFVQKARKLLEACRKSEKFIQQYCGKIRGEDLGRFAYFLKCYSKNTPFRERDQWNSIISTLSIKGFVKDSEVNKFLSGEKDKISWLKKHFVEELLQSYLSPLLVMLEEIRCAKRYGITEEPSKDVITIRDLLLEASKEYGLKIAFVKLFEQMNEAVFKEVEIEEILPLEISTYTTIETNAPMFISQYGVNYEGSKEQKTLCTVKL